MGMVPTSPSLQAPPASDVTAHVKANIGLSQPPPQSFEFSRGPVLLPLNWPGLAAQAIFEKSAAWGPPLLQGLFVLLSPQSRVKEFERALVESEKNMVQADRALKDALDLVNSEQVILETCLEKMQASLIQGKS